MNEKIAENPYYFVWKVPDQGFQWSWLAKPFFPEQSLELDERYKRKVLELDKKYERKVGERKLTTSTTNQDGIWPKDGPPYLLQNSTTARLYNPLESNPDLFMEFLNLDLTQDAILKFANTYGFLSQGRKCFDERGNPVLGESLYFWLYAKAEMNMLFDIDRWIHDKNRKYLKEIIQWSENGTRVTFRYTYKLQWEINNLFPPQAYQILGQKDPRDSEYSKRWNRWKRDDVIAPAKALLINRVNNCLQGTSLQLLMNNNEKINPYIHPMTLLDGLWLQFSQLIAGQRRFHTCKICHKWMDVTDCRRDKVVHPQCSKRERQRVWRENAKMKTAKTTKKKETINGEKKRKR